MSSYGAITKLAYNVTIGEDAFALHLNSSHWGWNARGCSSLYLAAEFAQPTVDYEINDAQVRAFCIWFRDYVLPTWHNIPRNFPTHSELDGTPQYGTFDGKTDVYPKVPSNRTDDLRARIMAHLKFFNI